MTAAAILPDVLAPRLRVVFCGTAAGPRSATVRAYYAGRANRFWPTLHELGLTPHQLQPAEFAQLLSYGIGLTDLGKFTHGPDRGHRREDYDVAGLAGRLRASAPGLGVLAFNGKRAAACYLLGDHRRTREVTFGGPQSDPHDAAGCLFALPSTSGAAGGSWSVEPWRALARHLGQPPPG